MRGEPSSTGRGLYTPDDRSGGQRETAPRTWFRRSHAALPTIVAIAYALAAYVLGLVLVGRADGSFVVGVLLLAHAMVIAGFLLHECVHGALFARADIAGVNPHQLLAGVLTWLTGSCYSDYGRLREKHLRHHFERADIVSVDYRHLLKRHPLLRRAVQAGQWLCLPAVELLFHALAIWRPLVADDAGQRSRVLTVLGLRGLYFGLLGYGLGWALWPGYALAYLVFLTVMGFMDAFQHQYLLLTGLERGREASPVLDRDRFPPRYFSREYEQRRTFSNLISARWPWLNLLVLNFCYHNAHHHRPSEAWCELPRLHRQMLSEASPAPTEIPLWEQLRLFFRYRVERVMAPASDQLEDGRAPGAAGVSFLTPL